MIFYQFDPHQFSVIIRQSISDQNFGRHTLDQKSGPSLKSEQIKIILQWKKWMLIFMIIWEFHPMQRKKQLINNTEHSPR